MDNMLTSLHIRCQEGRQGDPGVYIINIYVSVGGYSLNFGVVEGYQSETECGL